MIITHARVLTDITPDERHDAHQHFSDTPELSTKRFNHYVWYRLGFTPKTRRYSGEHHTHEEAIAATLANCPHSYVDTDTWETANEALGTWANGRVQTCVGCGHETRRTLQANNWSGD